MENHGVKRSFLPFSAVLAAPRKKWTILVPDLFASGGCGGGSIFHGEGVAGIDPESVNDNS